MSETLNIPGVNFAESYALGEITVDEYFDKLNESIKNAPQSEIEVMLDEVIELLQSMIDTCDNCPCAVKPIEVAPEETIEENWFVRWKRKITSWWK